MDATRGKLCGTGRVLFSNTFQCEQRYATAWKYIDLLSKSEKIPEEGQVGAKHLGTDVVLTLF
jgi:hypothetical protein